MTLNYEDIDKTDFSTTGRHEQTVTVLVNL